MGFGIKPFVLMLPAGPVSQFVWKPKDIDITNPKMFKWISKRRLQTMVWPRQPDL